MMGCNLARPIPIAESTDEQVVLDALLPIWIHVEGLLKQLNPKLSYHNSSHTLAQVYPNSVKLAVKMCKSFEECKLVGIAALFHDIGFLERYKANEEIGARMAREQLPAFGYTPTQIDTICSVIMATCMPQRPVTDLDKIICDADMSHFGNTLYVAIAAGLWSELCEQIPTPPTLRAFFEQSLVMVRDHSWFTRAAAELWDGQKGMNVASLTQLLFSQPPQI